MKSKIFNARNAIIILLLLIAAVIVLFSVNNSNKITTLPSEIKNSTSTSASSTSSSNSIEMPLELYPSFKLEELTHSLYAKDESDIYIQYPQFKKTTGEYHKMINDSIASSSSDEFQRVKISLEGIKKEGYGSDNLYYENRVIGLYLSPNEILSYARGGWSYEGGAHGSSFYNSKAFDLNTGRVLTMSNFLRDGYDKLLKNIIIKRLKKASSESDTPECSGCAILDDTSWIEKQDFDFKDSSFLLSKDGITMLFGSYILGSYVQTAGGQTIFISKKDLKDYIIRDW